MFTLLAVTDTEILNKIKKQYSLFGGRYAVLQFL